MNIIKIYDKFVILRVGQIIMGLVWFVKTVVLSILTFNFISLLSYCSTLSDNKASVRFQPSRIRMRAMHEVFLLKIIITIFIDVFFCQ